MGSQVKLSSIILLVLLTLSGIHTTRAEAEEGVAYRSENVGVPELGRFVPLDVFIPIENPELYPANSSLPHWVPVGFTPIGLFDFSLLFSSSLKLEDVAARVGDFPVREINEFGDVIGRGRALIYLPGQDSPSFVWRLHALEMARAGYVVFLATPPFEGSGVDAMCNRVRYAEAVVDFIREHPSYGNLSEVYITGHSVGGATIVWGLSDFNICNGPSLAGKVDGVVLLDSTWEATFPEHTQNYRFEKTAMACQACRYSQMLTQIEFPIDVVRMDIKAFVDVEGNRINPVTGELLPLGSGQTADHVSSFTGNCIYDELIRAAGGPGAPFAYCSVPEAEAVEHRTRGLVVEYLETFINHVSKGKPKDFPAGGQPDESALAHYIPAPPMQPSDSFVNICYDVLGQEGPSLIEFDLEDLFIPRRY